eukprot:SAG31_NODE_4120_length_3564_cov_1.635498_3_plen_84_part_00
MDDSKTSSALRQSFDAVAMLSTEQDSTASVVRRNRNEKGEKFSAAVQQTRPSMHKLRPFVADIVRVYALVLHKKNTGVAIRPG